MDILEPTVGGIIRKVIPTAPKKQRLSFEMRKGAYVDLPKAGLQRLFFSISVSMTKGQGDVDLDIAAVFMSKDNKCVGCCYFDKTLLWGVTHSGENECDEDISIDLRKVPKKVDQIFIVVNLTGVQGSVSFHELAGAFCKVTDQNIKEVANFALKNEEANEGKGLVVCRLLRVAKRWELQALGRFCKGSTWKACVPAVKAIVSEDRLAAIAATLSPTPTQAESTATTPTPAPAEEPAIPAPALRRRAERRATQRKNTGLFEVKVVGEEPVAESVPARRGVSRGDIRRRTKALDAKVKDMLHSELQEEVLSDVFSGDDGGESEVSIAGPEQEIAQPVKQETDYLKTEDAIAMTEDHTAAKDSATSRGCQDGTDCRCQ